MAIFDSATQEWRYENEYPLYRTNGQNFYTALKSSRATANEPPYGLIHQEPPKSEQPDMYLTPQYWGAVACPQTVLAYAHSLWKKTCVYGAPSA